MKFETLSQAIRYYAYSPNTLGDIESYGDLASQINKIPANINYINPKQPNVITYGVSIWGIGKIIDIDKPSV
jgi:hypothetical protein